MIPVPPRLEALLVATDPALGAALARSAARHAHLCPRQVLGARMVLLGARLLGLEVPRRDKRLIAIVETDGCFADGVEAASGCRVGGRTLRVEDQGKVAATFVDAATGAAWRVRPAPGARAAARDWAPLAAAAGLPADAERWAAYLEGYQRMPDDALLRAEPVALLRPVAALVGRASDRAICADCGEEIGNGREVAVGGAVRCAACAGGAYWRPRIEAAGGAAP